MKEPQWSWILNLHSSLQQEARFEFSAGLLGISFGGFETLVLSLVCRVLGVCGGLWASGVRCLQLDPGVCGVPKTLSTPAAWTVGGILRLWRKRAQGLTHMATEWLQKPHPEQVTAPDSPPLSLSLYVYNTI